MIMIKGYRVLIDDDEYSLNDPIVTGQQLLDTARKRPADEHLIFQLLQDGQLEDIRLDETVDLRQPGIEKFITWKSDRSFRFVIDGRQFEWGAPIITGYKLKDLAEVDPRSYSVWLEVRGGEDRLISDRDFVNLDGEGTERFFTKVKNITVIVNQRSVVFSQSMATGLEIKQAAIQQGVSIQEDFVLFEVVAEGSLDQIGDCDSVTLREGQVFRATAPDDNS